MVLVEIDCYTMDNMLQHYIHNVTAAKLHLPKRVFAELVLSCSDLRMAGFMNSVRTDEPALASPAIILDTDTVPINTVVIANCAGWSAAK
jgi:hypothetical protein